MRNYFKSSITKKSLCLLVFMPLSITVQADYSVKNLKHSGSANLSFYQAIKMAQKNDPWLDGSRHQQKSIEQLSKAANTEPDPQVSITFANLPTNVFDFSQEGMSQFKVGVSQMFSRGDSLMIKNQQLKLQSQQHPYQRQDRQLKVAVIVGSLWLDLYQVQESIKLIVQNRSLFEQLSDLAEASYSSGLGKTRQHDIVRAQLELTRLEDKLSQLKLMQSHYQGMLTQWLNQLRINGSFKKENFTAYEFEQMLVSDVLPSIPLSNKFSLHNDHQASAQSLALLLAEHPSVLAVDKKVAASRKNIDLAEQKYQPQWGVNASYGYRADDTMGKSRADLFSVGVMFDLPLFTENKQDNTVRSAISKAEAIKTEKLLLIRQLMASYSSASGRLSRVNERKGLYQDKLLPQIHDQAQASLTAYTNNDGDFAEVVRSRIAELNTQIDYLAINVQQRKITLEINYLFSSKELKAQIGAGA